MKKLLLLLFSAFSYFTYGQTVYNLNNQDLDFGGTGVTITAQVGTGTSVGDVVLYENVVTIGTQQIDAIVRTLALTGTMTNHDNPSTSGSGMSNNEARFFSPQFNFSGFGSCMFRFEFIEGGSYNTLIDSGTIVALTKVQANTYDIDGNGGWNSNQYNEFGGFDTVSLGNPTTVTPSFNFNTNLTKFRSNQRNNISNVLDDRTRVLVKFPILSSFDIVVGADGPGAAYFFIDFGSGATWGSTPNLFYPPELDLDTTTTGSGHLDTFCNSPVYFSGGGTNISSSNGDLNALRLQFTTAEIQDGSAEKLIIGGATSGDSIALNFSVGALIPNITFGGNTYSVTAEVVSGESSLTIQESGGGVITIAEAEAFIDSLHYYNSIGSSGERIFDTYLIDDAFASLIEAYTVNVNCGILPASLYDQYADAEGELVRINWITSSEVNTNHFILERSKDLKVWQFLELIPASGNSTGLVSYNAVDQAPWAEESYYRLTLSDFNGQQTVFDPMTVDFTTVGHTDFAVQVNPVAQVVYIQGNREQLDLLAVYNIMGQDLTANRMVKRTSYNTMEISLTELPKGILMLKSGNQAQMVNNL